ncbi:MAG: YraN family protein [Phenylobacterium sp.]
MRAAARPWRRRLGALARTGGRRAEWIALVWLMLKGWRILGFRLKTPQAEIDILALRGQVLAVVEVKSRASLEAALEAVNADQRERLRRAGRTLAARSPDLSGRTVRLDLMALAPGRRPRHLADAWPEA